jgi:hypothetical protein
MGDKLYKRLNTKMDFDNYREKFSGSNISHDELMRKFMIRMLEEEFRAFEALQNAQSSSAVSAAGGGQVIEPDYSFEYDPSYLSIINKSISLGYPVPTQKNQFFQNRMIVEFKSSDIWDEMDLFYCYATDANNQFAQLNWKDPDSFQILEIDNPVFIPKQGYKGVSTSYLDTQYNLVTDPVKYQPKSEDGGNAIWIYDDNGNNTWVYGGSRTLQSGDRFRLNATGNNAQLLQSGQIFPFPSVYSGNGLWSNERIGNFDTNYYYNGEYVETAFSTSNTTRPLENRLIFVDANFSPSEHHTVSIYSNFASIGASKHADLNRIMTEYMFSF